MSVKITCDKCGKEYPYRERMAHPVSGEFTDLWSPLDIFSHTWEWAAIGDTIRVFCRRECSGMSVVTKSN